MGGTITTTARRIDPVHDPELDPDRVPWTRAGEVALAEEEEEEETGIAIGIVRRSAERRRRGTLLSAMADTNPAIAISVIRIAIRTSRSGATGIDPCRGTAGDETY